MDLDAIRELNSSYIPGNSALRPKAMSRLGNPSSQQLVETALTGFKHEDRNVRVQMVRLLGRHPGARAAEGILAALGDPSRRVRKLANQLSVRFAEYSEIEARLHQIMEDEEEVHWIRSFHALSVGEFKAKLAGSTDAAKAFFSDLPNLSKYRQQAMEILVRLDPLTREATAVLKHVVANGTREEAVAATRALCGFKVISLGEISDLQQRKQVARTCEPARGRTFFWIPRDSQD